MTGLARMLFGKTFLFGLLSLTLSASVSGKSGSRIVVEALPLLDWKAGTVVTAAEVHAYGLEKCFAAEPISDAVFQRMWGKSYPKSCTVPRSALRYLRVLHFDGDGKIRLGELVCNKSIAADLLKIFKELYAHRYPIARMRLIDDYGADDERSMRANNTSCFCYRAVSGAKHLSRHARGMAIDINPLYNPYCRRLRNGKRVVRPATAGKYCDRQVHFAYKIDRSDLCYRLFTRHGFRWGGAWKRVKDYQHFEK